MNVLITGSSGYIGKPLVRLLTISGYNVVCVDTKDNVENDFTNPSYINNLITEHNIHTIIHLAAIRSIDVCEKNLEACLFINEYAAKVLYDVAISRSVKFVFASTSALNAGVANTYTLSKQRAEEYMTEAVVVRLSNVVGSYANHTVHEVPSLTDNIVKSLKQNTPLTLHGNCTRTYTFIDDVLDFFVDALYFIPGVYTCSAGVTMTAKEWIAMFESHFNGKVPVIEEAQKTCDPIDTVVRGDNVKNKEFYFCDIAESYAHDVFCYISDTSVSEPTSRPIENERYTLKTAFDGKELEFSRTELKPHQETRGHFHPNEEIYIFEDACTVILGTMEMDVLAGQTILIPSDLYHKVINKTSSVVSFNCIYTKTNVPKTY